MQLGLVVYGAAAGEVGAWLSEKFAGIVLNEFLLKFGRQVTSLARLQRGMAK